MPNGGTTRFSRRKVLITAGAIGVGAAAGGFASAQQEQGQEFQLEGETSGWVGSGGETNPTLSLQAGTDYTVTWENTDGAIHDFAIRDSNGETLVQSDPINEEGATQTVEFTASEDMATYLCTYHPQTMVGDLEVAAGDGTSDSGGEDDQEQEQEDDQEQEQEQEDDQEQEQEDDQEQEQEDDQEQEQEDDQEQEQEQEEDVDESTDDSEGPTMADDACPDDSKGDEGKGK
ncbi:cupredoxin domain-containing protein [Halalkalicoccus salilacus]|uniref:cupredoxin domain-containing protein n=1 Tax=Halalkalicoccus sp. GCM10025704 TaxID=3252662 RepID=UPI00360A052C